MDSAQWMQETGQKSMGEIGDPNASSCTRPTTMERKVRPQKEQALNCPRCNSTNTKFCYYNNYSLTQPRYFCKTCRRYWTEGGTLRSVPVGGGSRKNKKSSISSNNSSSLSMPTIPSIQSHKLLDLNPPINSEFSTHQNPKSTIHHDQGQDLNLGYVHAPHDQYPNHGAIPQFFEFPKIFDQSRDIVMNSSSNSSSSSTSLSALNLRRNGIGLNSIIPIAPGNLETNMLFASNFQFNQQECKPTLGFSFDGINNGSRLYVNPSMSQENVSTGSLGFPFGATKQNPSRNDQGDQGTKGQENSNGYWNGTLGGGSW